MNADTLTPAAVWAAAKQIISDLEARIDALERTPGPKGDPGEPGESPPVDAIARALFASYGDQLRGEPGAPGADAQDVEIDPAEVVAALRADPDFMREARGRPGANGLDRIQLAPRAIQPGDNIERGETVVYAGGLFQSTRKTTAMPDEQPGAYLPITIGVRSIAGRYDREARQIAFVATLTDGTESVVTVDDVPRYVEPGSSEHIRGDFWIEGNQLRQFDGAQWATVADLQGKPGARGRKGTPGRDGVGIEHIDYAAGVLTVGLSDADVRQFDLAAPAGGDA